MNNEGKPKFEIEIDDFDYENEFKDVSSKNTSDDLIADRSFLKQYDHYDNEEQEQPVRKPIEKTIVPRKKKKRGDGGFVIRVVIAIAVLIVSVGVSLFCFSVADDVLGMTKESGTTIIDIPEDASIAEVGEILEQKGVIKFPSVFKFYVGRRYNGVKFQSGQVALDLSLVNGYDNIISEIEQKMLAETVTISFPEGYTIEQIANKLEENGVCSASSFIATVKAADFSDYAFVKAIDYDDKYLSLEGYIFPDTYEFYVNDNATNVVKKFLNNFEVRFTDEMKARADELGMTVDEVIILASIIQMEAGDPDEMARVASVFHNRLNNTTVTNGRLESDVTIEYVEKYILPNVEESEKDAFRANYNTYKCIGIPAGAVCNPGAAAINAALYPADTDYFFFQTDLLGNYYYAKTLEEHNRNSVKIDAIGKGE